MALIRGQLGPRVRQTQSRGQPHHLACASQVCESPLGGFQSLLAPLHAFAIARHASWGVCDVRRQFRFGLRDFLSGFLKPCNRLPTLGASTREGRQDDLLHAALEDCCEDRGRRCAESVRVALPAPIRRVPLTDVGLHHVPTTGAANETAKDVGIVTVASRLPANSGGPGSIRLRPRLKSRERLVGVSIDIAEVERPTRRNPAPIRPAEVHGPLENLPNAARAPFLAGTAELASSALASRNDPPITPEVGDLVQARAVRAVLETTSDHLRPLGMRQVPPIRRADVADVSPVRDVNSLCDQSRADGIESLAGAVEVVRIDREADGRKEFPLRLLRIDAIERDEASARLNDPVNIAEPKKRVPAEPAQVGDHKCPGLAEFYATNQVFKGWTLTAARNVRFGDMQALPEVVLSNPLRGRCGLDIESVEAV